MLLRHLASFLRQCSWYQFHLVQQALLRIRPCFSFSSSSSSMLQNQDLLHFLLQELLPHHPPPKQYHLSIYLVNHPMYPQRTGRLLDFFFFFFLRSANIASGSSSASSAAGAATWRWVWVYEFLVLIGVTALPSSFVSFATSSTSKSTFFLDFFFFLSLEKSGCIIVVGVAIVGYYIWTHAFHGVEWRTSSSWICSGTGSFSLSDMSRDRKKVYCQQKQGFKYVTPLLASVSLPQQQRHPSTHPQSYLVAMDTSPYLYSLFKSNTSYS